MSLNEATDLDRLEWHEILSFLKRRELPPRVVPHAIVKLGKPFDATRIQIAKDVIAAYLTDPDSLVRHEATWFLGSWGRLREFRKQIESILDYDSNPDNRAYAAICLGRMFEGTKDAGITETLAQRVKRDDQPEEYRLACYEGLLCVERGPKESRMFDSTERTLADVEWDWIESIVLGRAR